MTTYLERLRARELENVRIRLDDSIEEIENEEITELDALDLTIDLEPTEDSD
mgnify:CR=1 FL=1